MNPIPIFTYQRMSDESVRSSFVKPARSDSRFLVMPITGFEHFDLLKILFDSSQLSKNRMLLRAGPMKA